ncbi:MAG: TolC family protein [Sterolibacterium sp.]|jgi:outer membrane protein TolC|nr:TolC family protein [Sterolibacterium sp.]
MKPARPCCRLAAVLLLAATAFAVLAPVPARAKPALPELPVHSELTLGAELGSLLDYARARNPAYAAAQAENRALDARATAAGRWPDPRLRVELMDMTRMGTQNLNLLPGRVGSTRYLWMQEIPWLGKNALKQEVARGEAEAAHYGTQAAWLDIAARIKAGFAQRYALHQSLQLTGEMLELMVRLEQIARTRYAHGLATQQDVIRAQLEQTALRSERINLEMETHHEDARLNTLLARPLHAVLQPPVQLPALPPVAALDETALATRLQQHSPWLQAQEVNVQAAEKNRALAEKNRYPDVTLGFAPVQYQHAVRQWDLMIEMTIPLQQETRRAQESEAASRLEAAQRRQDATAHQLLAELTEALSGLDAARRTARLMNEDLLPQAELTYQAALAGYEAGRLDFATLLEAQRQIRQGRLNRLKAEVEARLRLAQIERLVGGL